MGRPSRDAMAVTAISLIILVAMVGLILHRAQILTEPLIITTGAPKRPYHTLAVSYQKFLEQHGVDVEVRESQGSIENLERLHDPASQVKVGLLQGGTTPSEKSEGLLAMGRVLTEPVWIYYDCARATGIRSLKDLLGKRIHVGPLGSGTRHLAGLLLKDHGVDEKNATFLPTDAREFLKEPAGADAGFVVVAADLRDATQDIKRLAKQKCLLDMPQADGLSQRFPFLSKVTLHRGAFDMNEILPKEDIRLVASRAALVVRKDLDPALQNLLAQAVLEVQSSPGKDAKFFPIPGASLVEDDPEFAASTEARRVYRSEEGFFQRLLPFWIATFLDDVILYILALPFITILFQLFRIIPVTRDFLIRRRRDGVHSELHELERRLSLSPSRAAIAEVEEELANIAELIDTMPLPANDRFDLSRHIELIRRKLEQVKAQIEAAQQPARA